MSIAMLKHGVCYGQSMSGTEVHQQSTTRVQIREAAPPSHAPPSISIIANMCVEVSDKDNGVPDRSPTQDSV